MSARLAVEGPVTGAAAAAAAADGSTFCGAAVTLGTFCVSKRAPLEIGSGGVASMIAGCAGLPDSVGAGNTIVCDTASLANCGIWLGPVAPVFARLEPAVGEDRAAGVAGGPTSRESSIVDSKGSGTGKNAVRFRLDAARGLFFCEPFVVASEFGAAAFGELFVFVTGA